MNMLAIDAPEKVQLNKKIYGWGELDAAITDKARLAKETPLSKYILERSLLNFGHAHVAQLEERVIAVASHNHISLVYGHTAPGCGLESLELQRHVNAYPAQGGRTSYEIDMKVNGYFANKHLPMRAKDRGGKSIYRNTRWYYGQGGMYQMGAGPVYADIGPTCRTLTPEAIAEKIGAADWVPEAWRDKALSFLEKVRAAVSPFGDAVLRVELDGFTERDDAQDYAFNMTSWITGCDTPIRSKYGIVVRIKHPARKTANGWENQDDMAIAMTGPPTGWQDPDDMLYMVSHLHSGQGQGRVPVRHREADKMHAIYRKQSSVVDIARQWCGNNINIPA